MNQAEISGQVPQKLFKTWFSWKNSGKSQTHCKIEGSTKIHLMEKSWLPGIVPGNWKKGKEISLPDKEEGGPRKLQACEPCLCSWESQGTDLPGRHVKDMRDKQLIQDSQHGYKKGKSCLTNLVSPLWWSESIGEQKEGNWWNLHGILQNLWHSSPPHLYLKIEELWIWKVD